MSNNQRSLYITALRRNASDGTANFISSASIPLLGKEFGTSASFISLSSAKVDRSPAHLRKTSAPSSKLSDQTVLLVCGERESRDSHACLVTHLPDNPVVHAHANLTPNFSTKLDRFSDEPIATGRITSSTMRKAVLAICTGRSISLDCLIATLVDRDSPPLRHQRRGPLSQERKLRLAFRKAPRDGRQADSA